MIHPFPAVKKVFISIVMEVSGIYWTEIVTPVYSIYTQTIFRIDRTSWHNHNRNGFMLKNKLKTNKPELSHSEFSAVSFQLVKLELVLFTVYQSHTASKHQYLSCYMWLSPSNKYFTTQRISKLSQFCTQVLNMIVYS